MIAEHQRRRTFAIIAHPDAGKTTLTEKLLLFGGAIQLAGAVKAKGDARRAKSDWMAIEKARGISVTASVMTFPYADYVFNLLDPPGHEDFSEDTYRTLTAVDSAVMVLDGSKGIESQTLKLFEVCRMRNIPIITFINKLDREGIEPFDLLSEIEDKLALSVTPASLPIGMGRDFHGVYDLLGKQLVKFDKGVNDRLQEPITLTGLDDAALREHLPDYHVERLKEHVAMAEGLCPAFDPAEYLAGHQTPVFFGSAVNNFGVRELLAGLGRYAPPPRSQTAREREVAPSDAKCSGFVFKIQANMDPKHRDRIAFVRLCSGTFKRGMKLNHVRTGKTMAVHGAMLFMASDRDIVETAVAGDIIGIPGHGNLRIGDSLSEGEALHFSGVPSFAPEHLQRVRLDDPLRRKHLYKALEQLAEEGASQVFKPLDGSDWVVGVVGPLQFEVLAERLRSEYDVAASFEATAAYAVRWVFSEDAAKLKAFSEANRSACGHDHDGCLVFIARNAWHLQKTMDDAAGLRFTATREMVL
ncbi:MAG: peptide chain release factor 3 [Thalassospira sp.]|nr:peptide chain release factor 3 [Thalassospira sp.]